MILSKPPFPYETGPTPDDIEAGYDWKDWPIRMRVRLACEGPEALLFFTGNATSDTGPIAIDPDWVIPEARWNFRYQGVHAYRPRPWYRTDEGEIWLYPFVGRFPPTEEQIIMRGTGYAEYHNKWCCIVQNFKWRGELDFSGLVDPRKAVLVQYDVEFAASDYVDAYCVLMVEP